MRPRWDRPAGVAGGIAKCKFIADCKGGWPWRESTAALAVVCSPHRCYRGAELGRQLGELPMRERSPLLLREVDLDQPPNPTAHRVQVSAHSYRKHGRRPELADRVDMVSPVC